MGHAMVVSYFNFIEVRLLTNTECAAGCILCALHGFGGPHFLLHRGFYGLALVWPFLAPFLLYSDPLV
jgi:hypothetical protein